MRIGVDRDRCEGLGMCESMAHEFFELDDDGELVQLQDEVGEDLRANVEEAADVCPTQAITIEG